MSARRQAQLLRWVHMRVHRVGAGCRVPLAHPARSLNPPPDAAPPRLSVSATRNASYSRTCAADRADRAERGEGVE